MKILHLAYFGRSGKLNGVSEVVLNLAHEQAILGHDVKIGITTQHNVIDQKTVYYTNTSDQLIDLLDNFVPEIVIFHALYDKQQIPFSRIVKKRKIKYLLVFHGGASRDNAKKGWLKKKIANFLLFNTFIRHAERVIYFAENDRLKSVFREINHHEEIIPNGVNFIDQLEVPSSNEIINIGFVSRIDYYGKGLDVLLGVIKDLFESEYRNKLRFSFYGHSYDDTINRFLGFGDFSQYYGFVTGDDKVKAFTTSDIQILPSRSEGMPMTILESLSFGVPCIVTPETNMGDIVTNYNCGWVSELNHDNLKATIIQAVKEIKDNKIKYFTNARNAAKEYSWSNIALRSVELYKKVLEE